MMLLEWASAKWYSCCLVRRSKTLMEMSSDPETMNLLSLENATDRTAPIKEGEWGRRRKNDGTGMRIYKMVQLLLGLEIEDLDGVILRP